MRPRVGSWDIREETEGYEQIQNVQKNEISRKLKNEE
jgi:hypothetical protein